MKLVKLLGVCLLGSTAAWLLSLYVVGLIWAMVKVQLFLAPYGTLVIWTAASAVEGLGLGLPATLGLYFALRYARRTK